MTEARPKLRWYRVTPDRLVLLLLAVECLLWLSDRIGWPGWHKGYAILTTLAVLGVAMVLMLVWFAIALIFRRRFQISIRSLLILVVAVAIPCSWLALEAKEERDAIATIDSYGGRATRVSLFPKTIRDPLCLGYFRYFDRVDGLYLPSPCRNPKDRLIRALKETETPKVRRY